METRRQFLIAGAALGAAAAFAPARAAATAPRLLAAARIAGADGGAAWCDDSLTPFALPGRGHSLAQLKNRIVIAGRRPGKFAAIVDAVDVERPAQVLAPAKDCAFAGHAAVSPDGRVLVTSEFDAAVKGAIISRDPETGAVRAQWNAGGIEPHDLLFTKDGSRLIVAIGGLVHDGGVRGPVANPGGVDSAIVELDSATGRILKRHKLGAEMASLSMRHMASARDDETIVFGMQEQDLSAVRPLMGLLRVGRGIELLPMPDGDRNLFRGYIGSVAVDASGAFAIGASPRGGALGVWSVANGGWLGALRIADVCGLSADAEAGVFWATSGAGEVVKVRATQQGPVIAARWRAAAQFDNHLLRL